METDEDRDIEDARPKTSELWEMYISEMCGPDKPMSEVAWAKKHGITDRQVRRWKENPEFVKLQNRHYESIHLSPDKVGAVMENMWKIAAKGEGASSVSAANLYWSMVERVFPSQERDESPKGFEALTEEQLVDLARGERE